MYSFIFYRFYRLCYRGKNASIADFAALFLMSYVLYVNLYALQVYVEAHSYLPVDILWNRPVIEYFVCGVLFLNLLYFSKKRVAKIISRYSDEREVKSRIWAVGIICYTIASHFLFFFLLKFN